MRYPRKRVALIYGGRGPEREVSLMGKEVVRPLIEKDFCCFSVEITSDGIWQDEDKNQLLCAKLHNRGGFFLPTTGEFIEIDCAFPLLHGIYGEDGIVQGALDCCDIPYLGCDGRVGAICRDKSIVKAIAKELEIPILPYITAKSLEEAIEEGERSIGYPMFIKPCNLGSSIGAGVAECRRELQSRLKEAFTLCDKIIIEPYLARKRELECGYFGTKGKELFTNIGEILTDNRFYDYKNKYKNDKIRAITNTNIDPSIAEKIKEYSKKLCHRLGVRQISRIDFFLSGDEIFFNEINTMPGFTASSLYAKMVEEDGIPTKRMISLLIRDTILSGARH